jgi:hypothetical protein
LTGLVGVVPLDEGDGEDDLRSIFNEAADVRRPPTPLSEGVEESLRGLAAKDGAASSCKAKKEINRPVNGHAILNERL